MSTDDSLDELYQDLILDHHKHPRCQGCLSDPNASSTLYNPLCGDKINLTLAIKDNKIADIGFVGQGCSISQASASMMAESLKGRAVSEAKQSLDLFVAMIKGEKTVEECDALGDLVALAGVRKHSARIRCAMLAWEALGQCLAKAS